MKILSGHGARFGCALCAGLLAIAGSARSDECKSVHAQIVSAPTQVNCASPVSLCTAGTIDGNQGLSGTTYFTADSTAVGPVTAPNPSATIAYSGILQITTTKGTLTARDTGIFDTSIGHSTSGLFSSFDDILGGTGKYAGAGGNLFIGGRSINGQFVTTVITGELCLP